MQVHQTMYPKNMHRLLTLFIATAMPGLANAKGLPIPESIDSDLICSVEREITDDRNLSISAGEYENVEFLLSIGGLLASRVVGIVCVYYITLICANTHNSFVVDEFNDCGQCAMALYFAKTPQPEIFNRKS